MSWKVNVVCMVGLWERSEYVCWKNFVELVWFMLMKEFFECLDGYLSFWKISL